MVESIYKAALICCWSMMLFMGSYLIAGRIAEELIGTVYERFRKLIGFATLILGVEYLVFSLFDLRIVLPHYAIALSLSVLSITCDMFALAIFPLLDERYNISVRQIWLELIYLTIFVGSIWSVVLLCDLCYVYIVLVLGLIAFWAKVCFWTTRFFRLYRLAKQRAANYFSEDEGLTLDWLSKTAYFVTILSFVCGLAAFAPVWAIVIYILYACLTFYYIFSGVMGMMLDKNLVIYLSEISRSRYDRCEYHDNDSDLDLCVGDCDCEFIDDDTSRLSLRSGLVVHLEQRIKEWIEDEGYLERDITIKKLSIVMNTNRTYLSNYINVTYGCSFRDWVTGLRLKEAKRIIMDEQVLTIADLSLRVGFTSSASFSRAFSRVEGVSPARWREINLNKIVE